MTSEIMTHVVDAVATNPELGDLIEGTGGFRKFRFAKPGGGKGSGFRVISFFHSNAYPVLLATAFGKNQKDNLTKAERNALAVVAKQIVTAFDRRKAERK